MMVPTATQGSKGATMILHGLFAVALVASSVMARFLDANDLQQMTDEAMNTRGYHIKGQRARRIQNMGEFVDASQIDPQRLLHTVARRANKDRKRHKRDADEEDTETGQMQQMNQALGMKLHEELKKKDRSSKSGKGLTMAPTASNSPTASHSPTHETKSPSNYHPSNDKRSKSSKSGRNTHAPTKAPVTPKPTSSPPPSLCDKRRQIAFDILSQFGDPELEEPSDVTTLCEFFPAPEEPFNFGCPIFFTPDDGFLTPDFFLSIGNVLAAQAYNALTKYCECYQGYELGCAGKIPHGPPLSTVDYGETSVSGEVFIPSYSEYIPFSTPATRADYCKFAAVWNGDISPDDFPLSEELEDCGCFFVTTAKDMLRDCPGVDLGAFYNTTEEEI
mmetsp:Transcript_11663/g.21963  ORF Transcript_11663/g.21963 Transcript_11663/m.21963 type:complete len:390 (-) Transcript_11663:195-1364(-)